MSIRVIQWSTGNVGKGAIKAIAERADLVLAGLYVTSGEKAGHLHPRLYRPQNALGKTPTVICRRNGDAILSHRPDHAALRDHRDHCGRAVGQGSQKASSDHTDAGLSPWTEVLLRQGPTPCLTLPFS